MIVKTTESTSIFNHSSFLLSTVGGHVVTIVVHETRCRWSGSSYHQPSPYLATVSQMKMMCIVLSMEAKIE